MNHPSAGTPSRVRTFVQTIAIAMVLLVGVVALNWPITFAGATSISNSPSASQLTTAQESQSLSDVEATANQAVVTITNYQPRQNAFPGQAQSNEVVPYGVGSGYIIDDTGHVVTNNHVVAGGTAFEVEFIDGTTVDATLVGTDPFQDVAVLELDLNANQELPGVLSFGDSDTVRTGDDVIAIGSPYGKYKNTVSEGSVGAVDRALAEANGLALPNLIQHSAPIYEGNSGGPLLNTDGDVIGMNVAKETNSQTGLNANDQSGIGFAIESNAVKEIVTEIVETGTYDRAYLGISSQDVNIGQEVMTVEPNTPAAGAGLQEGDVITAIDGQAFDRSHRFANELLFDYRPGDTVTLSVERGGESISVDVTLGTRPADLQ